MAAPTAHATGTYTDTPSTTWDIVSNSGAADTTDGLFSMTLDLHNLAAGDVFEARLGVKDSGGTLRYKMLGSWSGAQLDTLPDRFMGAQTRDWTLELRQPAGTGRAVEWTIYKAV
jgi:hypothetical protein